MVDHRNPAAKQGISELHSRRDAVAIVGVGLERCQQWPARIAALARAADPDGGAAAVFAVALASPTPVMQRRRVP